MILRLWFLVVLTLAGAFTPSRASARTVETRTWDFFPATANARPESAPQVADSHQGNLVCGYELAPGYSQAAEIVAGDHIALGIKNMGLEQRAAQVGARTLLKDPVWRETLQTAAQTPSTRFTVFLDGFEGTSTYTQVMGAAQRGATPLGRLTEWEMSQLFQAQRLETTTFMRGGSVVPNPFGP